MLAESERSLRQESTRPPMSQGFALDRLRLSDRTVSPRCSAREVELGHCVRSHTNGRARRWLQASPWLSAQCSGSGCSYAHGAAMRAMRCGREARMRWTGLRCAEHASALAREDRWRVLRIVAERVVRVHTASSALGRLYTAASPVCMLVSFLDRAILVGRDDVDRAHRLSSLLLSSSPMSQPLNRVNAVLAHMQPAQPDAQLLANGQSTRSRRDAEPTRLLFHRHSRL